MVTHFLPKLLSTTQFSQPNTRTKHNSSSPSLKPLSLQNIWLIGTEVNINVNTNSLFSHLRSPTPRVKAPPYRCRSLVWPPQGEDNVVSTEKAPKWSWRAIKSFAMGELEARKLKYPNTGAEALLMGILVEGTSLAAKFLRANGVTLFKVCEEIIKLLGKGDMYFFSPEHPPLTKAAQKAIDWAVNQKLKSGASGEVTASHLLLGIWSEVDSPGHKILATLGFNDNKANELDSLISKPGVVDD